MRRSEILTARPINNPKTKGNAMMRKTFGKIRTLNDVFVLGVHYISEMRRDTQGEADLLQSNQIPDGAEATQELKRKMERLDAMYDDLVAIWNKLSAHPAFKEIDEAAKMPGEDAA
jgi:hypothetical protein